MNCSLTSDCPFQYQCVSSICQHYPIFPIQGYPMFVYLLLPFVATICNLGGLSIGAFKIILFMDMLNYSISDATKFAYITITGASLANLITLVNKRHPKVQSPLVDYYVVILLVPGLLLGTNLGVIVRTLLYDIIQDAMTILMLLFFGIVYLKKFIKMKKQFDAVKDIEVEQIKEKMLTNYQSEATPSKQQFIDYKKSYQIKDILLIFISFIFLTAFGVLCTGKLLINFKTCSTQYWLINGSFIIIIIMAMVGAYKWVKLGTEEYRIHNIPYDININKTRTGLIIIGGSLIAGLCQGTMGIGSGYVVIFCMLSIGIIPQVTAAVSGFIIFFVGIASLIQVLVLGQVKWEDAALLFGISFVGSFLGTMTARHLLKGKKMVDLIVMMILCVICFVSIAGVIVNVIMTTIYFGFQTLVKIDGFCGK